MRRAGHKIDFACDFVISLNTMYAMCAYVCVGGGGGDVPVCVCVCV